MSDYHINVFWNDEDKGWIADIPDLKFCSARGETPDEALREVQIVKNAWLASAIAHMQRVLKRTYRPPIYA